MLPSFKKRYSHHPDHQLASITCIFSCVARDVDLSDNHAIVRMKETLVTWLNQTDLVLNTLVQHAAIAKVKLERKGK